MCDKCNECEHCKYRLCYLFAKRYVDEIDKCILDYDELKTIKKDSFEMFVLMNNPILLLQFIGKNKVINVGDRVVSLRGGFGTLDTGKLMTVIDVHDACYDLWDGRHEYSIKKEEWWMEVFKIDGHVDIKYFAVHVTYGNGDSDGYSIPVMAENEEEAKRIAWDNDLFEFSDDIHNVDYVEEINKEEYQQMITE